MQILSGTSGFSYPTWRGEFYPPEVKPDGMLAYYAKQLPCVEINNTFYRMPTGNVLESWREQVDSHFRFAIKAHKRITHSLKLVNAEEPISYLAERVALLEDHLGAVLFQLPPYLKKDSALLSAFLGLWPRELPLAVEFRHHSWYDQETADLLQQHNAARVMTQDDTTDMPDEKPDEKLDDNEPGILPGTLVYLRLRRTSYTTSELKGWSRLVKAAVPSGANNKASAMVFFKHETSGPAFAQQFRVLSTAPAPKRAAPRKSAPNATEGATRKPAATSTRKAAPKATIKATIKAAPKAAAKVAPREAPREKRSASTKTPKASSRSRTSQKST